MSDDARDLTLKPQEMPRAIYLGDGAYATYDSGEIMLTTGHHELGLATECIFLGQAEWAKLIEFIQNPELGDPV